MVEWTSAMDLFLWISLFMPISLSLSLSEVHVFAEGAEQLSKLANKYYLLRYYILIRTIILQAQIHM